MDKQRSDEKVYLSASKLPVQRSSLQPRLNGGGIDDSMFVHEDRQSVHEIDDKLNDLEVFVKHEGNSSQSTADQDPVHKIFKKSKKLTEKH